MPTYKVKEGNRIQAGAKKPFDVKGNPRKSDKKIYLPGESITLTEEEAISLSHALEGGEKLAAKAAEEREKEEAKVAAEKEKAAKAAEKK